MNEPALVCRIYDATSARLATARTGDEVQAIGIEHMAATGRHLAEYLFARVAGEPFGDAQINAAILENLEGLRRSVVESFAAFGITEGPYLDRCLEAASDAYLERGEALFSAPAAMGGCA